MADIIPLHQPRGGSDAPVRPECSIVPLHRGVVHIRDEHLRRIFDQRPDPVELLRERMIAEAEAADELRAAVAYVVCIIGGAVFWLGVIAWVLG